MLGFSGGRTAESRKGGEDQKDGAFFPDGHDGVNRDRCIWILRQTHSKNGFGKNDYIVGVIDKITPRTKTLYNISSALVALRTLVRF